MIEYSIARNDQDLLEIFDLQKRNLPNAITKLELEKEGFVTVDHSLELLNSMNDAAPHIIAHHNGKVIGYALSMITDFRHSIAILAPMFDLIDRITYDGEFLERSSYVVMGQICIDKPYRGQGVFAGLYQKMSHQLRPQFDFIITEISLRNPRSIRAHKKVGFKTIHRYQSSERRKLGYRPATHSRRQDYLRRVTSFKLFRIGIYDIEKECNCLFDNHTFCSYAFVC